MLLDELQEHIPERYFSHYVNPNLLSAIYAATGRQMGLSNQPSDSMTYNEDENDVENPRRPVDDDYHKDQRLRQQQEHYGRSQNDVDEIDDDIDYGTIDD